MYPVGTEFVETNLSRSKLTADVKNGTDNNHRVTFILVQNKQLIGLIVFV